MTIERYRNDDPRTASEIADTIERTLTTIDESAPTVEGTQNYALIQSLARTIAQQQEESLSDLYDASFLTDAEGLELTKRARELGIQRQSAVAATGVVEFGRGDPATSEYVAPSGTLVSTGGANSVEFVTTEKAVIEAAYTDTDSTLYTTTNTSLTTQTSFTVDTSFRTAFDVQADIRTTNSSYSATLEVVDATNGTVIETFTTTNTTLTTVGPVTYDTSNLDGDITVEFRLASGDGSTNVELDEATVDVVGQTGARANVECTTTGTVGNVGPNTIVVLLDSPSGIESVTNPQATGDPSLTLTDGSTELRSGRDRESDGSLRQRALETRDRVRIALQEVDGVISARIESNQTNSTVDGLDPYHSEVQVYGGATEAIAEQLRATLPVTSLLRLQGGVNGTKETDDIYVEPLDQTVAIPITRPSKTDLTIDIDLVVNSQYVGDSDVTDAIVEYVGGTTTDSQTVFGLGQGEDVRINEVENRAEDQRGVKYANVTLLDADGDGTDDTTTDSDGVPIYDVANSEVPLVSASDITLSVTQR